MEGETEAEKDHMLQASGMGKEEGEVEVKEKIEDKADEVSEDGDAQGQDEGFREEDQRE